jgi:hypothetical protein
MYMLKLVLGGYNNFLKILWFQLSAYLLSTDSDYYYYYY